MTAANCPPEEVQQQKAFEASSIPSLPVLWSRSVLLAAAMLLSACSSLKPWINEPLQLAEQSSESRKAVLQQTAARDPSMLVAVTLSRCRAAVRELPRLDLVCSPPCSRRVTTGTVVTQRFSTPPT